MKRPLFIITVVAVLLAGGALLTFTGYRAGQRHTLGLQKGTFVGTVDALERIRKGDIEGGTRRIESLCFSSAVSLMTDSHYRENVAVRTLTPSLVSYRQSFRTNQSEWTPMERRLERLLAHGR